MKWSGVFPYTKSAGAGGEAIGNRLLLFKDVVILPHKLESAFRFSTSAYVWKTEAGKRRKIWTAI